MSVRLAARMCVLVLAPAVASPQTGEALRIELVAFEAALDSAVQKVSRPGTLQLLGGGAGVRGHYLEGYGAFFSIPARALPAEHRAVVVMGAGRRGDPRLSLAIRELERPLVRIESEEMRAAIERRLEELRRLEQEARGAAATPEPREARRPRDLTQQHREWRRLAAQRERELRSLEAQAEALQREAERIRVVGELHLDEIQRQIQVRLATPPAPASPPQPPEAPTPSAPTPPAPPEPPAAPAPWRFWFETTTEDEETRSSENVIAEVRGAVTGVLIAEGATLRQVRSEEFVAVAVDFVTPAGFAVAARPKRTLVLRVRKKEIDDHRAGRLPAAQLAERIEAVEY